MDSSAAIERSGIVGGGAWGTALALTARRAGRAVVLWAREADVVAAINRDHVNPLFLPDVPLDPAIRATQALGEAAAADALLLVVPAQHFRALTTAFAPHLPNLMPVVICTQAIDTNSAPLS